MTRHLLVTNDYPPKTGGIQVYLHELWRRLEPERAVVVTASSVPNTEAFDAASEIVVERVPEKTLFLPTGRAKRAIESAIERHQPDLVLLDPAWPLGLLGPRLSVPYGVVVHGSEVTVPGRLPFVASSLRYVLKHAAVAICAGSYPESEVRRIAAEYAPPIIQVPPGVDTRRFTPLDPSRRTEVRQSLGLDPTACLVSSYSKLAKRLDAPVVFLGHVPDDALNEWLGASDLMVMDCRSRWLGLEQEGFGIVFVEAGATGVAEIAGRSGGSHEAVQNGVSGFVVGDSRSDDLLAKAIRTLMMDDERRLEFGRASRAIAVERFDWNMLAARLSRELAPYDNFGLTNRLP